MAIFPRMTLLAIAAVTAVALSGCLAPTPEPAPSPVPSADPVFASEEEALAAATEAYAAYLKVSDQITQEGGVAPERISSYVTTSYLKSEVAGFKQMRAAGLVTSGKSSFDSTRLQNYSDSLSSMNTFNAYLCSDISLVRLFNSVGEDVTPVERQNRVPLEIEFYFTDASSHLLIGRSDVWSGSNFC